MRNFREKIQFLFCNRLHFTNQNNYASFLSMKEICESIFVFLAIYVTGLYNCEVNVVKSFFENGGTIHAFQFYGRRRYAIVQLPYLLLAKRDNLNEPFSETKLLSTMTYIVNTGVAEDIDFIQS